MIILCSRYGARYSLVSIFYSLLSKGEKKHVNTIYG